MKYKNELYNNFYICKALSIPIVPLLVAKEQKTNILGLYLEKFVDGKC